MRSLKKPNWQKLKEQKEQNNLIRFIGLSLFLLIPISVVLVYVLKNTVADSFSLFESNNIINGSTITVKAGGNFQAALDKAKAGDTILLQAGATFKGAFNLPNKTGNKFILIRTSASDAQLPSADTRIDPKIYTAVLPKLQSDVEGQPVILAANGAHHFRFVGIEFAPTDKGLYNIIQLGTGEEKSIEELPHHIEFDRVYIHGSPIEGQRRGIAANGKFIKITNSYISDIKRKGEESQAIAVWASDGPVEITNNYLEAAAENILFGGAGSLLKLVPTDCVVRENHLNKPVEWREQGWTVKNHFQIKNGRRIKVENNLMTNNWAMAQDGTSIVFTTRADNGDASVIEDIKFADNIVRGSGNAINIYGSEGKGGKNLVIRNNVFDDIDGKKWGGEMGFFIKSTEWDGLIIENNTIFQNGSITVAYGEPVKNFVFRNNIVFRNEYGFFGDNVGTGKVALEKYFPGYIVSNNIIIGGSSVDNAGNYYLLSLRQVGFASVENKDYRLQLNSPYLKKGFGGKPVGANLDAKMVGGK